MKKLLDTPPENRKRNKVPPCKNSPSCRGTGILVFGTIPETQELIIQRCNSCGRYRSDEQAAHACSTEIRILDNGMVLIPSCDG